MTRRRRVAADVGTLVELSRLLVSVAYRSLGAVSTPLPLPQFRALVLLARAGPTSAGRLADDLDMIPSTCTRLCDKLVSRGWVTRTTRPDNRREVRLDITALGRLLVDEVLSRRADELEQVLRRMRPESRQALAAVLPELLEAADATTAGGRAAWAV